MLVINLKVWEGNLMKKYLGDAVTSSKFAPGQVIVWLWLKLKESPLC